MHVKAGGTIFDATSAPLDQRSNAFTSLMQLGGGAYLAAFRTASGRDAPDGRLRIMKSDDGRTWSTAHPGLTATIDDVKGNIYSGYFTETEPGRLLGAFVWVDRSNPDLSFVHPETAGILHTRNLLAESTDHGAKWSGFREVDLSPETGCTITGPIFRVDGQTLALPYETWKSYEDTSPGKHTALLRLSHNGGATWPDRVVVASDPDAQVFYWDQRIAMHPETRQLVVMFWTHNRTLGADIENHIAWADATGRRWTVPRPTGWKGQHCQPLPLGRDRLAAIYVHRHHSASLRMVISEDFGMTWDSDNELTFYDHAALPAIEHDASKPFEEFWRDMMRWEFGHPRAVLNPDGDVLIAYYAGDQNSTSMVWSLIEL
ncbi:hypothetical protein BH20CHL4_BH20CHL4_12990 [soil metagenome]